ncbi:MAG: lysine--tRNA ligase [Deltaproteobacteria bacterium]|nr:MAG: lysine--tRNA ligase [Deltaproteobacteria bacterium]
MSEHDRKPPPDLPAAPSAADESEQIAVRRGKLHRLRARGSAYPNDFRRTASCRSLRERFDCLDASTVEAESEHYALAGRILALRSFGKTVFASLRDGSDALQLYLQRNVLDEDTWALVRDLDIGDIVGVEGTLFRTRTGELTLRCDSLRLLVKALRPLPEKWHGLTDVETRLRRRYVDLIVNEDVRRIFEQRSRVISGVRGFLQERGFMEVETPMMQPIPGGAAARPFVTHHNALSMDLYLRVAPELYLKRLVVGGYEKVFELNRNFRNEGMSSEHNPEFTMCEFYQAYATYETLMELTEELLSRLALDLHGGTIVEFGGAKIDYRPPFRRLSMAEAVAEHSSLSVEQAADRACLERLADELGIEPSERREGLGLLADVFEVLVEDKLVQPTFVTGFPVEVSPLARASDECPGFTDRFELYVAGREIANGFSELNDPEEQYERFLAQLKQLEAGDEEAHRMDRDFIEALEYGMPPTAGEGIGIDRLVMLLTGATSIREVILFPHMRPRRDD